MDGYKGLIMWFDIFYFSSEYEKVSRYILGPSFIAIISDYYFVFIIGGIGILIVNTNFLPSSSTDLFNILHFKTLHYCYVCIFISRVLE